MRRLGPLTVTGVTRTPSATKDPKGLRQVVESSFIITGCALEPLDTSEAVASTDTVVSTWRLYAPADGPAVDLTSTSAVRDPGGASFEVTGVPQLWRDLRGRPHHFTVDLRRPEG